MKRSLLTTVAVAAATAALAGPVQAAPMQPLSIFLVVGQSNAAGWGEPVPTMQRTNPRVWDLSAGVKRAVEPLGDGPGVGFAVTAGAVLARHGLRVGLVQCASGGLGITDWLPGGDWYGRCLIRAQAAMKYGKIRGILFSQGETDSQSEAMAAAWTAKFLTVIGSFRRDLAVPALPVVMQLTRDFTRDPYGLPAGLTIRAAQRAVAGPTIAVVSGDDLSLDGEHFTPDGYRTLGARIANAWLKLTVR